MIKWLMRCLWLIIWGKPNPRRATDIPLTHIGSENCKPIRSGRMVVQVFMNRRANGSVEPKFRLKRAAGKDGNTLVDNFYLKDLDDAGRGLIRAKAWALDYLELEDPS